MKSKNMLATNATLESRETNDFYATNPHALTIFLDALKRDKIALNQNIWECAAGAGHLSNTLEARGYIVKKSDLVDRGCGAIVQDFLSIQDKFNGDILTNPPFILAEAFLEKGMNLLDDGNKIILFLKVQFLESKSRKNLFEKYPPKYVYINSERQHTAKNGDFNKYRLATLCFCWYVWEKGYTGETIIRWI